MQKPPNGLMTSATSLRCCLTWPGLPSKPMSHRHISWASMLLRLSSCWRAADFTRSSSVGRLRVAKLNADSGASDTRVTVGVASLSASARIAPSARGQSGNR